MDRLKRIINGDEPDEEQGIASQVTKEMPV